MRSFTEEPTDLGAYGPLFDENGRRFTVLSARTQKNVVVVRLAEVTSREGAEELRGRELFVDRSVLPEEDEDEFYEADLVGLSARTVAGEEVGTVVAIHDFGAGTILEIAGEGRASVMIPFSEAAVPAVDLSAQVLTVEPVAAGLEGSDDEEGDEGDPRP
ncbi:16S rRNA processing protein RimM [Consotaella salsifontis]|uniref:Ribosome maturation factor RimM n=1 Tax=Consotaella salsifontis TaxID=1365950 RepID=A0A1T4QK99_9HYPH|nr:16S rRNA processing protein RimM [Consotaella salsifontis]